MINIKENNPLLKNSMGLLYSLFAIFIVSIFLSSCTSDDLAFEVIESPVLAIFEETIDTDNDLLSMTATFYELDKSGILDKNIGIDSTLITGMAVEIFINESSLVGSLTTDSNGQAVFEKPLGDLAGTSRLEWVGNHQSTPFRIYRNF